MTQDKNDMPEKLFAYGRPKDFGIKGHDDEWLAHDSPTVAEKEGDEKYIRATKLDEVGEAAKAVIDRWSSPDWKDAVHTGELIRNLEKALKTIEEMK